MTDLDQAIEKMEADLAALRRARDLMEHYGNGQTESPTETKWHSSLPEVMNGQSLTVKEIENRLKVKYPDLAYSTVFTWIKRATNRGEFSKRGKKYRYVDPSERGNV